MTFDVVIRGGTVLDGTGRPRFRADVAVRDGRIAAIGTADDLDGAAAAVVVDAADRFVAPGFIDIHTHSDRSILVNPRMESKIRQGVTTEVGGNCGSGVAPVLGEAEAQARRARCEPGREYEAASWPTMRAYFEHLERGGIAGHYATWTGHGTLRGSVLGYAMRTPTEAELASMQALLQESLEAGAFGLSTGLTYVPSG